MSARVPFIREISNKNYGQLGRSWAAVLVAAASFLLAAVPSANAQSKALPGTIQAEDFDAGLSGYAYWDSSSGNAGGQYRSTDVDIEGCTEGGYNVGWITPG